MGEKGKKEAWHPGRSKGGQGMGSASCMSSERNWSKPEEGVPWEGPPSYKGAHLLMKMGVGAWE